MAMADFFWPKDGHGPTVPLNMQIGSISESTNENALISIHFDEILFDFQISWIYNIQYN